jgi:2-oxoglutarate dehydrogenase E2 component (dihydrolipoamide succinyltransferase)
VRFYSPLVLNIAQSEGISMSELENIPGTGQEGRVSKKDILAYVANKGKIVPTPEVEAPAKQANTQTEKPATTSAGVIFPGMLKLLRWTVCAN